ncbi:MULTISPECIES: cyclic lactone autoinducer peptide [unclassified Clostridioides]|nr:cyclic lactone autoinducer peptide [Clostridioides sp. ES-S-0123-01]MCC0680113.1 cyclic lactone autoinducer peptide [Clostridioides sp. ES-S-0005-03]UDN46344.1 cyclic lactone autoinducer peptide [Clostridioides sp. ES-S-0173-01]UDN60796.1 cyclic lactone autoinducer peptide [Clostridioides sp. ES-W-0016-02]
MKKILYHFMKVCGVLAMFVAFLSANTTSLWHVYQPKTPEKLKNSKNH